MSATAHEVWKRDYVSHFACEAGDRWLPTATAQIEAWLRQKGFDVDLSQSCDEVCPGASLSVRRHGAGPVDELKVRLHEVNPTGTWTTELLAHDEPGERDWINLTVTNAEGKFVSVPRLARSLMDVLPLRDGTMEFTDRPQVYRSDDIERLVALLSDPDRHGLVFVAGTAAGSVIPVQAFVSKVQDWAKEVYGLAQVVVLDPAATRTFEERVGITLAAPVWTIRTYQPGVRFDDRSDSRRHRILGTGSLGLRPDGAIRRLLGDVARAQAATRPEDPAVLRVRRRFDRLENRRLVEGLASVLPVGEVDAAADDPAPINVTPAVEVIAPPAPPLAAESEAVEQVSLVKRVLGLAKITEQALRDVFFRASRPDIDKRAAKALESRVDELQTSVERLQDQNRELALTLSDTQLELEVARIDVDDREGRIRWLESRLHDQGDYEASYLAVPDEYKANRPNSFEELLARIESLPSVEFTGSRDEVDRLVAVDTNGAALRTAWDAVLALCDYVRAKNDGACSNGLPHYLQHTPAGYQGIPGGKFAETETGATMQGFGAQRMFPVPLEIHPKGLVAMKAHFKLARIGMVSPRMHIYDAHPTSPTVYIGYLGAHLDNTQTN